MKYIKESVNLIQIPFFDRKTVCMWYNRYIENITENDMFHIEEELKKLERRIFPADSGRKMANLLVPVFVCCAAAVFLVGASFSLTIEENGDGALSIRGENGVIIDGYTINDENGLSTYFTNDQDRYIIFNDILFRIVRINGDGTVRLMAVEGINRLYLDGTEYSKFNYDFNLDINANLNNWFNYYFANNVNVVLGTYDDNRYDDVSEISDLNNNKDNKKFVGLLSIKEYNLVFRYDHKDNFYLNNFNNEGIRYCVSNGMQAACEDTYGYDVLPVINIKADNFGGEGSLEVPYHLIENTEIEE